jgi:hypothetical protein
MSIAWENTVETQQFSTDPVINNKIKKAVTGLLPCIQKIFLEFPTDKDKELVADFLLDCVRQENIAVGTKRGLSGSARSFIYLLSIIKKII